MNERHARTSASNAEASATLDVLSDVLRTVRLTGAMLFLVDAATPWHSWAPRTEAFRRLVLPDCAHMVSYHVLTEGRCWAGLRDGEPFAVEAGDVLIVPHGEVYYLADPKDTPRGYGPQEALDFFRDMAAGVMPSTVAEGGGGAAKTRFICGFLGCDLRPFNPVLSALPPLVLVRRSRADDRMAPLVDFAVRALREPRSAGHDGVLLRLAELMFVEVLRRHLDALAESQTGWLAGLRDPLVGRALARLHAQPARAWTLDALAAEAGTSRSVLADRFMHLVGQPPMHYLTNWRMQLAAQLLAAGRSKLRAVADATGYASEAAFSRAFKKIAGCAPAQWREQASRAADDSLSDARRLTAMHLGPEQITAFERDGYLFLPGHCSAEEVSILNAEVPALYARHEAYNVRERGSDAARTYFAVHRSSSLTAPSATSAIRPLRSERVRKGWFIVNAASAACGADSACGCSCGDPLQNRSANPTTLRLWPPLRRAATAQRLNASRRARDRSPLATSSRRLDGASRCGQLL